MTEPTTEAVEVPPGLDDAEVYARADHPERWGRWFIRRDDTVVYQWPTGEWQTEPIVTATLLRTSLIWKRTNDST